MARKVTRSGVRIYVVSYFLTNMREHKTLFLNISRANAVVILFHLIDLQTSEYSPTSQWAVTARRLETHKQIPADSVVAAANSNTFA